MNRRRAVWLVIILADGLLIAALVVLTKEASAGWERLALVQVAMSREEAAARLQTLEEARQRASQGTADDGEALGELRVQLATMKQASPNDMERLRRELDQLIAQESHALPWGLNLSRILLISVVLLSAGEVILGLVILKQG